MGDLAVETDTAIYAWALLDNHAHILLRSGPFGLPAFMRRLLTGYAVSFNLRHRRHGHLFQNRYKSIVCEEDPYFRELVRYIHLNPLRAGRVNNLTELERFPWCGHKGLMGKTKSEWQDHDYVLRWFGQKASEARRNYRRFVFDGVAQGRRPDLVGGGLVRSQGGWSAVKAMRRLGFMEKGDERILGSGEFVQTMTRQAEENVKHQFSSEEERREAFRLIQTVCEQKQVSIKALRSGSRIREVSRVRSYLSEKLVNEFGFSLAETARQLGVSTAAIANSQRRKRIEVQRVKSP
jgi:REP element-mobilizing transposase RayT